MSLKNPLFMLPLMTPLPFGIISFWKSYYQYIGTLTHPPSFIFSHDGIVCISTSNDF